MAPVVRPGKRGPQSAAWDLEVRPHKAVRRTWIVAVVIGLLFTIAGVTSAHSTTGVNFRGVDQVSVIVFGWLLAAAILVLTRPRVRIGPQGVSVRNVLGDSDFQWKDIRGVSVPDKKAWARLELVGDEYVPMMAFRVSDGDRAAAALDRLRELGARYTAQAGN